LQSSQSLIVVWLISDLVYELRVHDLVVSIGNDDTTCQKAREWGILQGCAEVLTEGRTESRACNNVLQAFCCAETIQCERQVLRDGQHNGVVQGVCFLVEAAGLCLAYTGVVGWEQGKNQALACVVCWGDVGQVGAHNSEVWKSFAYCWKLACGLCWIGLKSYISHDYDDTSVFTSSPLTIFLLTPQWTSKTSKGCAGVLKAPGFTSR